MTVFRNKQRGNRWVYDFESGGERYRGYAVDPDDGAEASTKRAALAVEDKIRVRARQQQGRQSTGVRPGSFTLMQAVALHLQAQTDSSKLHVENLKNYAREILAHFGPETPVVDITAEAVAAYRVFCAGQTLKVWRGGPRKDRDRADPKWWKDTGKVRTASSGNHYLDCLRASLTAAHNTRNPTTNASMLPFPPPVKAFAVPTRKPTPMPDVELEARAAVAKPWTRDAIELARLFGLRQGEALKVTTRHIRTELVQQRPYHFLFFRGEELKGGTDEAVHGGWAGADLLVRLSTQARARGQQHLVTWPGIKGMKHQARGEDVPKKEWQPLKSIRRSWRSSGPRAGIEAPHRYHDVRARYGTELAKNAPGRVVQAAMRHKHFATTQLYIDAAEMDVMAGVEAATSTRPIFARPAPEQTVKTDANETRTESPTKVPNKRKSRPAKVG